MGLPVELEARGGFGLPEGIFPAQDRQLAGPAVAPCLQGPGRLPAAVVEGIFRPRQAVGGLTGLRVRGRLPDHHPAFFRRLHGVHGDQPVRRHRDSMGLAVKLEAGRGLGLFQGIFSAQDRQLVGDPVTPCLQSPGRLSLAVVEGVLGSGQAVGGLVRPGIGGGLFNADPALVHHFVEDLGPVHGGKGLCGVQGPDPADGLVAVRRLDLPDIIDLVGQGAQVVGPAVLPGRKDPLRLCIVPGVLDRGVEPEFRPLEALPRLSVLFIDTDLDITGSVFHPDILPLSLRQREGAEGLLLRHVALGHIGLLQIVGPGIQVKDRPVPVAAHPAVADGDRADLVGLVGIRIDPGRFRAGLVRVDAETDLVALRRLVEGVGAVFVHHIRIRAGLGQDHAGRLILLDPAQHIGLHPVPVALGAGADIDKDLVLVREGFGCRAGPVGGDQGPHAAAEVGPVIFDPGKLRIAHGHGLVAGCDGDLASISKAPGGGQVLAVIVQHRVIIQLDHDRVGDPGDIGKDRPPGPAPVIGHRADSHIFISVPVADIDGRRVSGVAALVGPDPQGLVVDLGGLADDLGPLQGGGCRPARPAGHALIGLVELLDRHPFLLNRFRSSCCICGIGRGSGTCLFRGGRGIVRGSSALL